MMLSPMPEEILPPSAKHSKTTWSTFGMVGCTRVTRRMLEVNTVRGGMKRLMEEVVVRHVEAINYSATTGICVSIGQATSTYTKPGF